MVEMGGGGVSLPPYGSRFTNAIGNGLCGECTMYGSIRFSWSSSGASPVVDDWMVWSKLVSYMRLTIFWNLLRRRVTGFVRDSPSRGLSSPFTLFASDLTSSS